MPMRLDRRRMLITTSTKESSGSSYWAGMVDAIPLAIPGVPFGFIPGLAVAEAPIDGFVGWFGSWFILGGAAQLTMTSLLSDGCRRRTGGVDRECPPRHVLDGDGVTVSRPTQMVPLDRALCAHRPSVRSRRRPTRRKPDELSALLPRRRHDGGIAVDGVGWAGDHGRSEYSRGMESQLCRTVLFVGLLVLGIRSSAGAVAVVVAFG